MIDFSEFHRVVPEIAGPIRARFATTGLALLGTTRADGAPRVSPIEIGEFDGRAYVGMMPGSRKHRDVERDRRVCLLTPVADREDLGGEGKLFGALEHVTDPDLADAVLRHHAEAAGFDADALAGSQMFEVLVDAAAWQMVVDDAWTTLSWRHGADGVRRRSRTN